MDILGGILIFVVSLFVISYCIGTIMFWKSDDDKKYEKAIVVILDILTLSSISTIILGSVFIALKIIFLIFSLLHIT